MKNKIDKQYLALLKDILKNGNKKIGRNGETISVFGRSIRHSMKEGFPLLTSKRVFSRGVIVELLWFLRGETNIRPLVEEGVHIWTGDAFKNYQKKTEKSDNAYKTIEEFTEAILKDKTFAEIWGELGPIYGKQWRNWKKVGVCENGWGQYLKEEPIDQIANLVNDLKNNPDSRRLIVNAWNVSEIDDMALPPCHYGFQCYTRELRLIERISLSIRNLNCPDQHDDWTHELLDEFDIPKRELSLMWNQRSVDTPLGLPFNIASYGFLLSMLAQQCNMIPGELIGELGDTHIYSNQLDGVNEQLTKEVLNLPELELNKAKDIFSYSTSDFKIKGYKHSGVINYPLSN